MAEDAPAGSDGAAGRQERLADAGSSGEVVGHWVVIVLFAVSAAAQEPDLRRVTEAALRYDQQLPNFVCRQTTRRSVAKPARKPKWVKLDRIEEELTYFDRRERYRLLAIDGKPSRVEHKALRGFRADGMFGALLSWIFREQSHTGFTDPRTGKLRERKVWIWDYRVTQANSRMRISNLDRTYFVGFHGQVFADCETGAILRILLTQDIPAGLWMESGEFDLSYGTTAIAGVGYLVPLSALVVAQMEHELRKNEFEFSDYRKYSAEASVTFEAAPK